MSLLLRVNKQGTFLISTTTGIVWYHDPDRILYATHDYNTISFNTPITTAYSQEEWDRIQNDPNYSVESTIDSEELKDEKST